MPPHGNVRATIADYVTLTGASGHQESWYKYDEMNRYTLASGSLSGTRGSGSIVKGSDGIEVEWNAAGQRMRENARYFTYTEDGHLKTMAEGHPSAIIENYTRDALGRATASSATVTGWPRTMTYNKRSELLSQSRVFANLSRTDTFYDYAIGGVYQGGAVAGTTIDVYGWNGSALALSAHDVTTNSFEWWDAAQQDVVTYDPSSSSANNTTDYAYGGANRVASAAINDASPRTAGYVTDASGALVRRSEGGTATDHLFAIGGVTIGSLSNAPGQAADFDTGYQPQSLGDTSGGATYQVQSGDTLQGIASRLWGDASLWYKLAEANGLSGAEPLADGRVLRVPAGVSRAHHDAATFEPYDPNAALGRDFPGMVAINQVPMGTATCGAFGQILMIAVAVAVSALMPLGGGIVGGAISGMIGSAASQFVGLAMDTIDRFSFKSVALAGIGGGVTGGMTGGGAFAGIGNTLAQGAVRAVTTSAISQGVGLVTGLQKKFDFAGLAAAGVAGAATGGLGLPGTAGRMAGNMAGGIANVASRSLLTGTSFGDNVMAALPDIIGNTLGNMMADVASARQDRHVKAPTGLAKDAALSASEAYFNNKASAGAGAAPAEAIIESGLTVSWSGGVPSFDRHFLPQDDGYSLLSPSKPQITSYSELVNDWMRTRTSPGLTDEQVKQIDKYYREYNIKPNWEEELGLDGSSDIGPVAQLPWLGDGVENAISTHEIGDLTSSAYSFQHPTYEGPRYDAQGRNIPYWAVSSEPSFRDYTPEMERAQWEAEIRRDIDARASPGLGISWADTFTLTALANRADPSAVERANGGGAFIDAFSGFGGAGAFRAKQPSPSSATAFRRFPSTTLVKQPLPAKEPIPKAAKGTPHVKPDYSVIADPPNLTASTKPTPRMVREMKRLNMEANGGVLRDDVTGEIMVPSVKSQRGVTHPANEVQVDHIIAIDNGGTRTITNLELRNPSEQQSKME